MAQAGHPSGNIELITVLDEFSTLCDGRTAELRLKISDPQARSALWRWNTAAAYLVTKQSKKLQFSVGAVLAQGACLLVAVLRDLKLLEPAWTGPVCDLSEKAVPILKALKGSHTEKVC